MQRNTVGGRGAKIHSQWRGRAKEGKKITLKSPRSRDFRRRLHWGFALEVYKKNTHI